MARPAQSSGPWNEAAPLPEEVPVDLFQLIRCGSAVVLVLIVTFAGCSRNPERPHPVETADEACRIATQHLFTLGQDTSRSTEHAHPDYPISLDTLRQPGAAYVPGPWDTEDSPALKAALGRLNGKVFWVCRSDMRRPATAGLNLVTDGYLAWVFIDARTGEVLLTYPHDYDKLTGLSH